MPSDMTSDIQGMIKEAYYKLNVRGVGELLTLGTVNKAFRRSVDQLLLAVMKRETPSSLRFQENANHQAEHWIALGCVSFVREAEMRGETKSKLQVRSFMYTMAYKFTQCGPENAAIGSIYSALNSSSLWFSKDKETRDAERDAFSRMATSRLAPGGQSLLPWVSEEDIRKTLALAAKIRIHFE